ncbi:Protein HID1 [Halotydeus destructor]|nr:Protein HID1 [Halotydeus destructor]
MGNTDTKLNFRKAVVELTTKNQPIDAKEEQFWDQFWSESMNSMQDVFNLIPASEIRTLREESPSNLATLVYKAVERLVRSTDTLCNTAPQQQIVLNSTRLLVRLLPYIFEDPEWRGFFWSNIQSGTPEDRHDENGDSGGRESMPLAQSLLLSICDLLFCPDFTVAPLPCHKGKFGSPDSPPEDLQSIDSCEYIWEPGVGFTNQTTSTAQFDRNRTEILRLLITCFSSSMYLTPNEAGHSPNKWIEFFTSSENRHALPLFTSLINTVFSYDPTGYLPFNHLLFTDTREALVDVCVQILIVTLDYDFSVENQEHASSLIDPTMHDNLFINYLARIHREEDFRFILRGFSKLLNNPLMQTYLPNSTKKIHFHQELFVLFWKVCDYNKKFMYYVLKSSDVLDILVPILYHLNDSRSDQSRIGLIHIGVFILLLLSGERNFGVRLNKPYSASIPMDLPIFTGTHADLLVIVFHKLITTGHQRLQPLFDCLLTIVVNVSPYLKTLSMVSTTKLLHLLEAFSTPWFLFTNPTNHHLVFFLLEIFNNIIQYQFDGNSNLVYTIIRKRNVFHALANLPTDYCTIQKTMNKNPSRRPKTLSVSSSSHSFATAKSPSISTLSAPTSPVVPLPENPELAEDVFAEANINVSLAATPRLDKMTERTHPNPGTEAEEGANGARNRLSRQSSTSSTVSTRSTPWQATPDWVVSWKQKLPLQTIMRMLQVLVPQVEKMCIDKGITDENEILKFLQHGTLVGLLPVPHPILIRKYQTNSGTTLWFRTYMWGVIYLRNVDPPVWYDSSVRLFEIQKL